jgi:hypothetical protein
MSPPRGGQISLQQVSSGADSSDSMDKGQGIIPGAVTSAGTGNNPIDTQISIPKVALQTRSSTIQNAGDLYWSRANWYCRHCKISGDKIDMEVHICKGYG